MSSFADEYVKGDSIGVGTAAETFKCISKTSRKAFAAKELKNYQERRDKGFEEEANFLLGVNHPNIVKAHRYFEKEKILVLSLATDTLWSYINPGTFSNPTFKFQLTFEEKSKILLGILNGTKFLHDKGIVHRDLCPQNILLSDLKEPWITDFGMSSVPTSRNYDDNLGNPKIYAPPEQDELLAHAGKEADVFSIAMIAYHLFTGKLPKAHPHKRVHQQNPQVGNKLSNALYRALNVDPNKRPSVDSLIGLMLDEQDSIEERYNSFGIVKNLPVPFSDHFGAGVLHLDPHFEIEKRIIESDYCDSFKFAGIASRNIGTPRFHRKLSEIGNAKFIFPDVNNVSLMKQIAGILSKRPDTLANDIAMSVEQLSSIQASKPVEIKLTDLLLPWRFALVDDSVLLKRFYGGDRGRSTLLECKEGRFKTAMLDFFDSVWENSTYV